MNPKLQNLTVACNGLPLFLIEVVEQSDTAIQVKVYEVTGWVDLDFKTPCDTALYLQAIIKWDGCSHITFGENKDGYIYLCGKHCFVKHNNMMKDLWDFSTKNIKKFDKDVAS